LRTQITRFIPGRATESTQEVIETKLLLELLMSLLAEAARLDGRGQRLQRGLRWQV
jgi:hypothetical protein